MPPLARSPSLWGMPYKGVSSLDFESKLVVPCLVYVYAPIQRGCIGLPQQSVHGWDGGDFLLCVPVGDCKECGIRLYGRY